jgi:hypothetical protein
MKSLLKFFKKQTMNENPKIKTALMELEGWLTRLQKQFKENGVLSEQDSKGAEA